MSAETVVLIVAVVGGYLMLKRITDLLTEIRNLLDYASKRSPPPPSDPHF
ncbi:hypothetical protein [Phenylobacterium sp.]|nr:hypothetical protein [Phenylobacterium sp.]MDO8380353.1 hypothetical protein [Phenylobacterium sp.]